MTSLFAMCACGHLFGQHDKIDNLHSCKNPRCYCGKFTPTKNKKGD